MVEADSLLNQALLIGKNKTLEFKVSEKWNPFLKRQLFFAKNLFTYNNASEKEELTNLISNMENIYGTAQVCDDESNCLDLDPGLTEFIAESRDYDKLLWAWKGWHDSTGPFIRKNFTRTVEINNKAAKENKFNDLSESWIFEFQDKNFEKTYDELYNQIRPLYEQLHAYVRRKLKNFYESNYPENLNPDFIPAHLLGNMWAQSWSNVYDLVIPYPDVQALNLTKSLHEKNYTVHKMFKTSEQFFTSLGFQKMTPFFWEKSMFERPNDREVICHGSAYDFYNGYDYRIAMCTKINAEDFYVVHHEMGHIAYFMAYSHQPTLFRDGANSGFHEAIGDTISLSVQTPKHLKAIDLIENGTMNNEESINFLMLMALDKVAFLPFGYMIDKWRWDVFRGKINESNYNQKWWEMREQFQGIESPIPRDESVFDPGAKYHIPAYVPYARYFIANFLQFQFYESLCKLSDHTGPLYNCDFYGSKKAGLKLKNMLKLGSSKHWSYALKELTGSSILSASSLMKYFEPLYNWLIEENSKYSDEPGF